MKVPQSPPNTEALIQAILGSRGGERLVDLLRHPQGPAPGGRYLHWDELRHRAPPAGALAPTLQRGSKS